MELIDYNGNGRWTRQSIFDRYARYANELKIPHRDLSPREQEERGRHWVYPVMDKVIEGIEEDDAACIRIGIEFIEEDTKFPFGKILKSNTARALRRTRLTASQKQQIRCRVFKMLRSGIVPHEFQEYAKLVKKIGFEVQDIGEVPGTSERVTRFRSYLLDAVKAGT